jgi:NAD(P)-dependent dehydrogenase (short-subunit alcohol dehydrogenase family)
MNPTGKAKNAAELAKPLADKVALVTGGTRGIGKAIAQKLASLGAGVSICGRNEERLLRTAREFARDGVRVHAQKADVSRNSDVTALLQATEKNWPHLDSWSTTPASECLARYMRKARKTGTA